MEKSSGIVLRVPSGNYYQYVVMDKKVGKIMVTASRYILQRGSLIQYIARRERAYWIFDSVDVLHVPYEIAKNDILFLHHLLELCYYCLPVGSCAREVAEIFDMLYIHVMPLSRVFKKIIIFKLLLQLGMYPDEVTLKTYRFHAFATESIDTIEQAILHLDIEKDLDQWLYSCVASHPHAKYFKTLSLYQRID